MPSGGITITPGYQLAPGEKVNNTKLNQLGQPVGRIDEGAITDRELDVETLAIAIHSSVQGRNLLCNGTFELWDYLNLDAGSSSQSGVIAGGRKHDYGGANRWVTPNDAARETNPSAGAFGQPPSLAHLLYFVYQQTAPLSIGVTGYVGQRLEGVEHLAGQQVTLSAWAVSGSGDFPITPAIRQYFGTGGSPSEEVIIHGDPITLANGIWQKITHTFQIPTIEGKVLGSATASFQSGYDSFTELRFEVPGTFAFVLALSQVQLELGPSATAFDRRGLHDERVFAGRYYEKIGMVLSDNITTYRPFVNFRFWKRHIPSSGGVGTGGPTLTLVPSSGTGATIVFMNVNEGPTGGPIPNIYGQGVKQNANHTLVAGAPADGIVTADAEMHAPS